MMAGQKYNNRKIQFDGKAFDSQKEYERYVYLNALQRQGKIKDLQCQVRFDLIPAQKLRDGATEKGVRYIADFTYRKAGGEFVVEDVKGFRTPDYIIKRKLMLYINNIEVIEV